MPNYGIIPEKMAFPVEDVRPLLPQKSPFVMVGKLLFADESITRSSFAITGDTVFVENNLFREGGLLENIAQTAALGAGYIAKQANTLVKVGYIGAVKYLEIFSLPKVGDELLTETVIENEIFDISIISGKIWCNEQLLAMCELKVFSAKA